MPNHIHGIIIVNKRAEASAAPTIAQIIRSFKSRSAMEYLKIIKKNKLSGIDKSSINKVVHVDFGIVGDCKEVLSLLIKEIKKSFGLYLQRIFLLRFFIKKDCNFILFFRDITRIKNSCCILVCEFYFRGVNFHNWIGSLNKKGISEVNCSFNRGIKN